MTLETVLTGPNGLKTYPNGGRLPLHSPLLEYKFVPNFLHQNTTQKPQSANIIDITRYGCHNI